MELSSNSTWIIVTWAGHDIPNEEPELVVDAILKLVNEVQGTISLPCLQVKLTR